MTDCNTDGCLIDICCNLRNERIWNQSDTELLCFHFNASTCLRAFVNTTDRIQISDRPNNRRDLLLSHIRNIRTSNTLHSLSTCVLCFQRHYSSRSFTDRSLLWTLHHWIRSCHSSNAGIWKLQRYTRLGGSHLDRLLLHAVWQYGISSGSDILCLCRWHHRLETGILLRDNRIRSLRSGGAFHKKKAEQPLSWTRKLQK